MGMRDGGPAFVFDFVSPARHPERSEGPLALPSFVPLTFVFRLVILSEAKNPGDVGTQSTPQKFL
jgi:hypothetical protein